MSQLLILTSPPASGKTFMIKNLGIEMDSQILVIAPLRALANECKEKWSNEIKVMTPEEWIQKKCFPPIVIVDEFHLNFYWGDSFRPIMWEVFYELSLSCELMIVLTATLNEKMLQEISLFYSVFQDIFWFNAGNQELKYYPKRYIKFLSLDWPKRNLHLLPRHGICLIFCQYRQEVYWWKNYLESKKFKCLGCVGGEAAKFSEELSKTPQLDFIIATTVLSHGVNLPSIGRICFTYKTKNIDFWIQMLARGGRKGEEFEVYSPEIPFLISFSRISNAFFLFRIKFRMILKEIYRDIKSWFLKVS